MAEKVFVITFGDSFPSPFLSAFLNASMRASRLCLSRIFCWLNNTMADMLIGLMRNYVWWCLRKECGEKTNTCLVTWHVEVYERRRRQERFCFSHSTCLQDGRVLKNTVSSGFCIPGIIFDFMGGGEPTFCFQWSSNRNCTMDDLSRIIQFSGY